jgi:hypothetical protein
MAHLPVNHPARPYYRLLAGAVSLYILVFGIAGLVTTWGAPFFDRREVEVLGLQTNPAFSLLSIMAGSVLLGGTIHGRNIDHFINLWGSIVFLLAGVLMMAVLHTSANLLNFALTNCIASFIIGAALLLAGLYGKVGPPELQEAEDHLRHGELGWAQGEGDADRASEVEARTDVPTGDDGTSTG